MAKKFVTPEEFVRAWQVAPSVEHVARKFGLRDQTVSGRANAYRKKGVPLKRFSASTAHIDYAALSRIAKECVK